MATEPKIESPFAAQADTRVITLYGESEAGGYLWPIPDGAAKQGIELLQDSEGRLYLTRTSADGFVSAYRIHGKDGKQLSAHAAYRPGHFPSGPRDQEARSLPRGPQEP